MPKAELIIHRRVVEADGSLVEIKIWRVPANPRQPQGVKYSLVYIAGGQRLLGYDNAHGSDHRHIRDHRVPYHFRSPAQLTEDFWHDLRDLQEGKL